MNKERIAKLSFIQGMLFANVLKVSEEIKLPIPDYICLKFVLDEGLQITIETNSTEGDIWNIGTITKEEWSQILNLIIKNTQYENILSSQS